MHAYLAAAPPTWTCHTIYVCAKYGATSHFYLWALCAAICYMYACVKNTKNTEMLCNTFEMYITPPPPHTHTHKYVYRIPYISYLLQLATVMKWRPMVIYRWSRRQRLPFQTTKIRLDSCHRYHRRCVPPKCFSRWAYFQVLKQSNCIYIVAIVLQFLFVLLLRLLYLFSSICCSIERSSNCTIVASFVLFCFPLPDSLLFLSISISILLPIYIDV